MSESWFLPHVFCVCPPFGEDAHWFFELSDCIRSVSIKFSQIFLSEVRDCFVQLNCIRPHSSLEYENLSATLCKYGRDVDLVEGKMLYGFAVDKERFLMRESFLDFFLPIWVKLYLALLYIAVHQFKVKLRTLFKLINVQLAIPLWILDEEIEYSLVVKLVFRSFLSLKEFE